ncbi:MAG: restriction endonuclease [Ferrovibrio sp.]|uniref:restriction endonuclease n=1 Tax=Ferrovibrio sp. TaxID=1917215 RepID=UPI00391A6C08
MAVPKFDGFFSPLLKALHELGGSATVAEQESAVAKELRLSEKEVAEIHRGSRTKVSYRLAWARNYLKWYGLIENSKRGVWSLTTKGLQTKEIDKEEVKRTVRGMKSLIGSVEDADSPKEDALDTWEDELLELIKKVPPDAFERLCKRLLRESGFTSVEVTGRPGDGGIDGKGVVRLGGILSFHVLFQCKRYKGTVSPSVVRDFRGALVGRADKGLIITTGTFSRDAQAEAQRDGATPIDLIDGESLVEKLKELGIGVHVQTKTVEEVVIDKEYFSKL